MKRLITTGIVAAVLVMAATAQPQSAVNVGPGKKVSVAAEQQVAKGDPNTMHVTQTARRLRDAAGRWINSIFSFVKVGQ